MRKRKNTRNPSKKIRLYSVFPVFFGIFVFLILIALAAFSTTSLSGYNMENSSIKIMNLKSFPVVGGDWKVNFTTIGKSNLTISSINGTHFGTDISLQSVECGNSSIHFSWLNSDTAFIPDYSCNVASTETSRELISGNHTIQFDFGGNLAEAHNYAQRLNWVVQSGETTMNAQTTVVNIPTPVNTSRAFILYSVRASTTYDDPSHSGIYLQWVNGTRFNLIQGSASSFGAIVDWYVIEGGSLKVQSGVQSYTTTSTSFNIPITSTNISRSIVFMGLGSCASTTNTYLGQTRWTGSLTSSTNLYIQRDYSGNCAGSVSYFVVEFDDGSNIQGGAISNVGSSSYAYVNPINLSNTWFYFSSAFGSTATRAEDQGIIFRFYNSTAFQLSRNSGARSTARVQWYAISTPGAVVQKGATNLGSSTSVNVPISSVVANRSISFVSFNQTSISTAPTYMLLSSLITSTTTLNIRRGTSAGTEYSGWEAVKLPYNPPSVTWNMSSLSLGSQPIENGNLTGTAQIYSFLTNNNTQISCTSGNCSYITDDFTTSNLVDMQYSNVHFTCSNTTVGHLSALFSVTSTQDTSPNYINVSCGFTDIHPPTGSLISPTNDSYLNSRTQNLTAVISDNYALSSAKLLIYNSSNSLINSTLKLISGKSYTLGIIYHFPYDGVFRWSYRLNDTSGNTHSIPNNTLIIDTTNPLLSYSSGTATNDTNTTRKYVYVNVSFSDINFANVTYSLYDGNMNPVNITTYNSQIKYINWTGLSDGTYYYNVQVYDLADNSNTTQTRKITIDTTAPVINILSPKPRQYLTNISLPLNVSVTDAGVGVSKCWWNLDNHPNQTILCNENTTFNTSVGTHTLYFYSNDSLGNLAESSVTFDTSAGGVAVQLLTPITDAYLSYKKNINFSFIPKSAFLISSCSLYGNWSGSWKINQTHHSLQNWSMDSFLVNFSSDGSYLWNVWCNDTSGKSNFNLVNKTFTIDTINPLIIYGAGTYLNDTYLNSTSIFVNTSVIELNFANITFSLYNGTGTNLYSDTFTDSTRSDTWNYLPEGVYYYNVTVYDRAGNKNSTSTRKITLDTTAPNANLITPLNGTHSNNRNQNLSFNATDNIALKNATLNVYNSSGKLINTTTILISGTKVVGGIVYEFLYDGVFNWFYRVFDMAGNVVLTSNNTLSIDSIAPSVSYSTGTPSNNSKFQGNWIYVNTSASDMHFSNITFDLYNSSGLVNETTYAGNSVTSINWTNLASGNVTYKYNVTAEDTYGNFNHTSTRTIELIDTIPPYVHIITPKNETYSTNVSLPLSFTATDLNLKSCWYNIDHSANITITCNQGTTFSTSDFQEHTLYLYANDTLGNTNLTKVSFLVNTSYIPTSTYNVQRGSVSVNGNSIVPINEIDPSKSFIILDAVSSSSAPSALQVTGNFSDPNDLSFYNYAGGAATVQWEAITGPYIKAQRGENSYTSTASSITIPISAVNLSSSFIIVYNRLNSGTSNQYISGLWTGHFVNSTAIQVQRTTTGNAGVVSWQVVSWKGASVQSGATILGSTATTNTSSLATPVNKSESFLIFSGTEGSSTGIAYWNINGALSSNSITFTRSTASGTYIANWFAVSGNMFDVNNGSVSMTSSTTTTIPQLANVSKSFRWQSHTSTGTGNTNANGIVSSAITGATTLTLYKGTTSQTNIVQWQTIEIVDRTPPSGTILSPKNNTYTNRTSQNFVLNATDNLQLGNATLNIYNSSGKLINTTTILLSGTNDVASVVYEFLYDGVFHWFYRIFDAAGNSFNTTNNTLTIDTINPLISYSAGTYSNNTYTNKKYIYVNVTSYDLNFANLTFSLYNSTGLVNKTTYNLENTKINWTNLADGIYYYNATAGDLAGNSNSTKTRKATVDTTDPLVSYSSGTLSNGTYVNSTSIFVNTSVTELNFANITFNLYNSTRSKIYSNLYTNSTRSQKWSSLPQGSYYYNVTVYDLAGNKNSTLTRKITLDTTAPNASLMTPANDTYSKSKNQNLSFNATDNIALKNATLNVYNSSGKLINTTTILISGTKVVGGIVYEFLYDGVFNWFYRVFDMAGNVVLTSNNTITIDTTPPSVTLNSPANNSLSTKIVHLSANFNDANNLSNATLYLWNSTGKIVNKTTVTLSGKSGSANISINLSYYDTFRWNYASCDFLGNCNFGVSNRTIKYEKPSLGLSLVYPKSSITVGQNKFFNVTLNVSCLSGICGTSNISLDPSNWWNNNWLYRRTINLTGAGKILTNYQVLVNLNLTSAYKNGKLNSDCSDIRFVNSSGSSLNYWIQSCNIAGGNSSFWVKVPIISASGATPITMYYGNPLASSISNGTKTFNYYNTANSTSGWTIVGAAGSTSAQGLPPPSYYANSASGDYMYTNASLKPNETISFNVRSNGLGNLFFLTGATGQGQMFRAETRAGNNAGLGNTASWTSWSVPSSTCSNIATNTWYNFTVNIGASTAQAYINGVACGSPFTYTNRGPYIGLIGDGLGATYTTWWDNLIVRQYSTTTPTITLGTEQAAVKSGLVSAHVGDVPFYTNASNPRTTISLSKGQSQKVTFWVNSTGVGTNTFFAYANLTSNLSISNMTKSWNVTIDNVPPKVTVISPSNRTYNLSNINFSVSGNENLSLCNFSFNNFVTNYKMSEVNSTVFSKLNFHIADGRYTAKFLCEDLAGNVNSSAKVSFTVDAFGANASLISPKNNTYSNKTTQNFTLSANDSVGLGEAIFNLYNSTGSLINTTTIVLSGTKDIVGVVYEFLYDGIFHWFYRVVDSGGHVTNTQNRTIIIDNVTPLISFSSGTLANNTNISHNWIYANVSVTEVNPGNLTFYLYNGTGGTHLVNKTSYIGLSKKYINWTKLADGVYYYKASETDLAGNYNVTSMRKIRLDTHAPVITTTFPVNNFAYGYNITHLNYTISDPLISQCWYNLNQTVNITIPCGSTGVSVFLSDGHYNWTIYANDTLGHLSYKMVSFLVDTHLPSVKIFYPQNLTYAHNVTQMNFSATAQSLDSCWYSLNGGATNITTSCNQNLTGLTSHEGQNDWRVYANNSAGGQAYAFVYFTVDTTPPHLTVSSPVTKTYYPSKINFNISGNENLGGCNLSINSWMTNYTMDKLSSTSFGYSFSPAPGTYTAKFSCNDTAGNINSSLSVPFNVSYPTILLNVTYPLKNENILHNSKFNFSVNVTCLVSDCGQVNVTLDPSTNWWNRDWEFRQRFNISVPSGSTPAGYQTKMILNSSNVGSDFSWSSECVNSNSSRIRFVNSYQNSTLPYWVQSCSSSGKTMILWVKLDKILNTTGYPIYLYYGNPSASVYSNGTATFDYFDSGSSVSSWTIVGSAGQTATTGNPTPSYYAVSQNGNYMYKNINLKPNETIMFDSMSNGLGNLFFLTNAAGAGQMFRTETRSGQSAGLTSTTSWTAWTAPTACSALSTNTWYNIQINLGSTTAQSYVNGISCGGAYTFTNNGGYIGLVGDALGSAYTTWWDNLIVRKYSSVTPSYNTGAEEIIPKTIISTSVGAKPFYANANPILTNSLNVSQSQLLTFFVNATGYPETYKFFAFGNLTKNQSVSNISNARNITIITVAPPTIKLIYPSKNAKFSNHTASKFSFSVSDSSFSTCQLWGNWSGSWALNQTLLSVPANVTTNFAGINFSNDGVYKWNVKCNDGYGDYAWNSTNYTFAAYFPPTKPLLVNITQTKTNGKGNITLYWSKTNHTTYYNVYYSPNMQGPFISLANTTKTNYTDKTFSGKLSRFYFVKSANPVSGNSSSKYFGAIVYTLSHTTGTSNLIGFPVNFSYLTNANKTLYSITNATSFNLWNATIQKRVTCNKFSCPNYPSCTGTNCNFNLNTGQGYEVNINSSAPGSVNWSGVGIVNSPVNVHLVKNSTSFGENWISIYANTTLSNAKALLTGISISDTVSRWNPLTQSSQGYLHLVGPIYLGANFPIKITEGYEVSVVSTGNWTQV